MRLFAWLVSYKWIDTYSVIQTLCMSLYVTKTETTKISWLKSRINFSRVLMASFGAWKREIQPCIQHCQTRPKPLIRKTTSRKFQSTVSKSFSRSSLRNHQVHLDDQWVLSSSSFQGKRKVLVESGGVGYVVGSIRWEEQWNLSKALANLLWCLVLYPAPYFFVSSNNDVFFS